MICELSDIVLPCPDELECLYKSPWVVTRYPQYPLSHSELKELQTWGFQTPHIERLRREYPGYFENDSRVKYQLENLYDLAS